MVKCSRCRYLLTVWVLWLGLSLGCGAGSPAWAQPANIGLPPDLQALIAESLKANAEVKQMASMAGATKETIKSAGALEDPTVSFGMTNIPTDTWRLNQEAMTQKMLGLSQKFSFPGKRRLRSEVAAEQAKSECPARKAAANPGGASPTLFAPAPCIAGQKRLLCLTSSGQSGNDGN